MKQKIAVGLVIVLLVGLSLGYVLLPRHTDGPEMAQRTAGFGIKFLKMALDSYRKDHGHYPNSAQGLAALVEQTGTDQLGYLEAMPVDPWGREYVYRAEGSAPQSYLLYSRGPSGLDAGGGVGNIK